MVMWECEIGEAATEEDQGLKTHGHVVKYRDFYFHLNSGLPTTEFPTSFPYTTNLLPLAPWSPQAGFKLDRVRES